jgi:hypothetical protein
MSTTLVTDVKSDEEKKDFFHEVVEQTNSIGGEIQRTLKSISQANNRARMLSTTAKIESNRLGDVGRDFLIVSHSIDELSTKTDDVIEKMKIETVDGIENLASAIENKATSINGNRLANLALSNIRIVDRNLFERAADIRWWATDDILVQSLLKNDSFSEASDRLETMLESYPVYFNLVLCDTSGNCKASANSKINLSNTNFRDKPWFQDAMNSKDGSEYAFQTVHYSPNIQDYTVSFSCKVHEDADNAKPVVGVLAAVFKWREFAQKVINEASSCPARWQDCVGSTWQQAGGSSPL